MKPKQTITIDYERLRRELSAKAKEVEQYRPWTREEDMLLREFYGRIPGRVIAEKMNRTPNQIYNRIVKLGLKSDLWMRGGANNQA